MTTMTTAHPGSTRSVTTIGAATGLVAATLTTLFAHDWVEVAIVVPIIAAATAVVFGLVVPRGLRRESAGGPALTMAVVGALLVVPAFWAGLPLVLGVGAMVLGNAGRTARSGAGTCIAALVLGSLTTLFYLFVYVSEGLAGQAGSVFG